MGPAKCEPARSWGVCRFGGLYLRLTRISGWAGLEGDINRHYLLKPRSKKKGRCAAAGEFHFRGRQIESQHQPRTLQGPSGGQERENFEYNTPPPIFLAAIWSQNNKECCLSKKRGGGRY